MGELAERMEALRDGEREPLVRAEADTLRRLERACRTLVQRNHERGFPWRAAHAKVHAYLHGRFRVAPDLPAKLARGVLREPSRCYDARVRLSSTNPRVQSDERPDTLGLAIKLLGVEGERIVPGEPFDTQDLLLVSSPVFFTRTPEGFASMLEATARGTWALMLYLILYPLVTVRFLRGLWHSRRGPLGAHYFSQVAYALGEHAVHWHARPRLDEAEQHLLRDWTREARSHDKHHWRRRLLARWLSQRPLQFVLYVRLASERDGVDSATRPWSGELVRVGLLELPAQRFDSRAWMALGERVAFSPYQSLVDHRPLGVFGRARAVYADAERTRRELRGETAPVAPEELAQLPRADDPDYVPTTLGG